MCKGFYITAVPFIYRHVSINFTLKSHVQLLSRLIGEGTTLPTLVRGLTIIDSDDTTPIQTRDLCVLFFRLTNLEFLRWVGFADIPKPLLDVLATKRFPRGRFIISAKSISRKDVFNLPPPAPILMHEAVRHLTSFELHCETEDQVTPRLKVELVVLLLNSWALTTFDFSASGRTNAIRFGEMPRLFRECRLARLKTLKLTGTLKLFTKRELHLWGVQGGFQTLEELQLSSVTGLMPFVGKVPRLRSLHLFPRTSREIDRLDNFLNRLESTMPPLGMVSHLAYVVGNRMDRDFIPWSILRKVSPTIVMLDIAHPYLVDGSTEFAAPTTHDLKRLRQLCPGLRGFVLDVKICDKKWPPGFLAELAHFEHIELIRLFIHQPWAKETQEFATSSTYRQASKVIHKTRKSIDMPQSFKVGFKDVRAWEEMEDHWHIPDYERFRQPNSKWACYVRSDDTKMSAPDYSSLSAEELAKLRNKLFLGRVMRLGINLTSTAVLDHAKYKAVVKQCEQNKSIGRVKKTYRTNKTLFDEWLRR